VRPSAADRPRHQALHFATNGAEGMQAALYHGLVSSASLPRLEEAAVRRQAGGGPYAGEDGGGAFGGGVLSAVDVLLEAQLAQRALGL
jgi:hypothetical protein